MKRIAINGMGRIGRAAFKIINDHPELELVAINDITDIDNIIYLIGHDSVHGKYHHEIRVHEDYLYVGDLKLKFFNEADPARLPWAQLEVDVVIESTGIFTNREDAEKHIHAGAKTVVLSGPTKSVDIPTVVHGVNGDGGVNIFSCASCTTNNISPVIEILGRRLGIEKAIMTTIHADTASNAIVDGPSKKNYRMGRSGLNNLIPTTTGAAVATTKAMPEYKGRFDGLAIRVPVAVGSISDITMVMSQSTSVDEVNAILEEESLSDRYAEVFTTTTTPLVSTDIVKSSYASIADLPMTKVVDGTLVKVLAWYDNEWGFTNQMIRQILTM